ncbi:MAG: hypothetical protein AUI47_12370 [Acidobacteria bacterium 13_1_40CM_2_68_5]|nr:MAG: hypothetical protein AUI47_12370 [Acidobacteria bacterium 13_1_40CM_2_68_5]
MPRSPLVLNRDLIGARHHTGRFHGLPRVRGHDGRGPVMLEQPHLRIDHDGHATPGCLGEQRREQLRRHSAFVVIRDDEPVHLFQESRGLFPQALCD